MARLGKPRLIDKIVAAFDECDWDVFLRTSWNVHPARLSVERDGHALDVRTYIWNITHGGATRSPDEYRIQVTGVGALAAATGAKSLLLGWSEDFGVFAGWDIREHLGNVSSSPSMQVSKQALMRAAKTGFAPYVNHRGETAIAFRPDFIGLYASFLQELHDSGQIPKERKILTDLSSDPGKVADAEIDANTDQKRRYAMISTRRALRAMDFSRRVLEAYSHRCAMCGLQLRLLDAAHILPAAHEDSTDETGNGVALCSLHHRAYDKGLVYFDKKLAIKVNETTVMSLKAQKRDKGIAVFRAALQSALVVPSKATDHPKPAYIDKANKLRGTPG